MHLSVILCTYKTPKMTAYTVSQVVKYSEGHDIEILICDNNPGDGTREYLEPFKDKIKIIDYPKGFLQSHGIGYSYLLPHISNEYFICLESDSFPTTYDFIDYYKPLIENGYDMAAPLLQLSGGQYLHPCGGLYKKSMVEEYEKYCRSAPYHYLPNSAMIKGFPNHLMVHNDIWEFFLQKPEAFVNLPENCKGLIEDEWLEKEAAYRPTVCAFHNGMGMFKETIEDYGERALYTDPKGILLNGDDKIITKMGYEPGQALCYWAIATGKKIAQMPIAIKWMKGRELQQQEYTLTDGGIYHAWAISSYTERKSDGVEDIYKAKRELPDKLYESLPDNQKIKSPAF